ncbi:carbohydrate kinase family protein [Pseudarthrobacter sp. J1738]|uniref:carbohydrate kinase family protein n=1 Tax=unclassified Pseudarthrobacter TaxID=2647000 RepID=UPI003D294B8E
MLTVIGEALVDVVQRGEERQAHAGGSPLNVAVGMARLDHPVQFIGRYGNDAYGHMITEHLRESSVMVPVVADAFPTSVATANIDATGAASYTFDLLWELPSLKERLPVMLQATTLLHTGSIATVLAPGASQVLDAVEHAHPAATISFDPNCRPSIVGDPDSVRELVEKFVALADVVKASDEDLQWLYPGVDPLESARRWKAMGTNNTGPALVIVTRGADGPWGIVDAGEITVPARSVDVADTVGAGDSFMAALLSALVDAGLDGGQRRPELHALTAQRLTEILSYAAHAAAITVSRPGANPPTRAEINQSVSSDERPE